MMSSMKKFFIFTVLLFCSGLIFAESKVYNLYDFYTDLPVIYTRCNDNEEISITAEIALAYNKNDTAALNEIKNRKIEIIDFLRSYFSKKTYAEIYGHKDLIQIEIRDYINEKILTQSRIREIIFIKLELLHL